MSSVLSRLIAGRSAPPTAVARVAPSAPDTAQQLAELRQAYARAYANLPDDVPVSPHFMEWMASHTPSASDVVFYEGMGQGNLASLAKRIRALTAEKSAALPHEVKIACYVAIESATAARSAQMNVAPSWGTMAFP